MSEELLKSIISKLECLERIVNAVMYAVNALTEDDEDTEDAEWAEDEDLSPDKKYRR